MPNFAALTEAPIEFKRNARAALADGQLRRNFRGAMDFLMVKRAAQFVDDEECEQLRAFGPRAVPVARLARTAGGPTDAQWRAGALG